MANIKEKRMKRRQLRIRKKIVGTAERPRLSIRRTLRHTTALVCDDRTSEKGSITLLQVTTNRKDNKAGGAKSFANSDWAAKLGAEVAAKAKEKGIEQMVFDRGGTKYCGVVKAFCDAVRKGGVKI
jgi:large subunit ribosomal protein L18